MSKLTVPSLATLPASVPPSKTSAMPPPATVVPVVVAPEETTSVPPLETVTLRAEPGKHIERLPDETVTEPLPVRFATLSVEGSSNDGAVVHQAAGIRQRRARQRQGAGN